ncbi:hypothetical protein B0H16DRAFT_1301756 [Mycena metata]|uniref:NAD(P)-binding protein n=1 Tax=Mycena metata TaxID=1033252 RepID=A0AAD7NV46_9AGAR|nr:hypothetical protein B0H16DRAFT_1301756 [Mycena metata]
MRRGSLSFIAGQMKKQKDVVKAHLTGETVLVLGANTGIGLEASKHFASMNPARLIMACRSESKGKAAVEKLRADTGYAKAEVWIVDLADFASVTRFADKFEQDGGRLDILVEDAGMGPSSKYESTTDGWEASLQVNCLSTPLVALRLLPTMIRTGQEHCTTPRIVVVSSEMHYYVDIEKSVCKKPGIIKTLGSSEYCTKKIMANRYRVTKLLNVFFVRALNARLLSSTPLIVNAVNPSYCASDLRRGFTGITAAFDRLTEKCLAFSPEMGSRRLVWAAVGEPEQPNQLRGEYINACVVEEVSDFVLAHGKVQDSIWDESVEMLGQVDPKVTVNVDKYLSTVIA